MARAMYIPCPMSTLLSQRIFVFCSCHHQHLPFLTNFYRYIFTHVYMYMNHDLSRESFTKCVGVLLEIISWLRLSGNYRSHHISIFSHLNFVTKWVPMYGVSTVHIKTSERSRKGRDNRPSTYTGRAIWTYVSTNLSMIARQCRPSMYFRSDLIPTMNVTGACVLLIAMPSSV